MYLKRIVSKWSDRKEIGRQEAIGMQRYGEIEAEFEKQIASYV